MRPSCTRPPEDRLRLCVNPVLFLGTMPRARAGALQNLCDTPSPAPNSPGVGQWFPGPRPPPRSALAAAIAAVADAGSTQARRAPRPRRAGPVPLAGPERRSTRRGRRPAPPPAPPPSPGPRPVTPTHWRSRCQASTALAGGVARFYRAPSPAPTRAGGLGRVQAAGALGSRVARSPTTAPPRSLLERGGVLEDPPLSPNSGTRQWVAVPGGEAVTGEANGDDEQSFPTLRGRVLAALQIYPKAYASAGWRRDQSITMNNELGVNQVLLEPPPLVTARGVGRTTQDLSPSSVIFSHLGQGAPDRPNSSL